MLATAEISIESAKEIYHFCKENNQDEFAFAKDQGAYFCGAPIKKDDATINAIKYISGCNPESDKQWYDNARYIYGGDDFGIHLPIDWIKIAVEEGLNSLKIEIKESEVRLVVSKTL